MSTGAPRPLALLRESPELLRYRAPFQWITRATTRDVEFHGLMIPIRKLVLPVIGAANRDPSQFSHAKAFDICRDTNRHIAFGYGIHVCLGAPLARPEARIGLGNFLEWVETFELASNEPWEPRKALQVLGPTRLPIRFKARYSSGACLLGVSTEFLTSRFLNAASVSTCSSLSVLG